MKAVVDLESRVFSQGAMDMLSYFDKEVNFNRIFGNNGLSLPNKANAQQWIDKIEHALSPENLTCDGELSRSQVVVKKRELDRALAEVTALQGIRLQLQTEINARYTLAFNAVRSSQKRERTQLRAGKLSEAIQQGFRVGTKVVLSNGLKGTITKINRTRVKVLSETRGTWNVPPSCMKLA